MKKQTIFYVTGAFVMCVGLISGTSWGHIVAVAVQRSAVAITSWGYRTRTSIIVHDPDTTACVQSYLDTAVLASLTTENEHLRQLLNFQTRTHETLIGAHVMTRSTDPTRYQVTIDRGAIDHVRAGKPVVALDGVFVGMVESVTDHTSIIRLLADPQSNVAGRMLNAAHTEGVVSGGHGIVVRMELVPRTEKIEQGQQLISSGLDPDVPEGLLIGSVIALEEDSNTLFQRVIVESPLDYTTLTDVAVIE